MESEGKRGGPWGLAGELRAAVLRWIAAVDWLAPLLGRLAVGLLFVSTGWGKVHDIPKVTAFFQHLHIPAPGLRDPLVCFLRQESMAWAVG